jgi:uncharacterized repeat protein (TIGR03833 family)
LFEKESYAIRGAVFDVYRTHSFFPCILCIPWLTKGKGLQMSGSNRSDIKAGTRVQVVQKQDQRTGKLTEGIVKDILTKSSTHPHGIKVRLTNGVVGRVKKVLSEESER